jgi:hypothetical protein
VAELVYAITSVIQSLSGGDSRNRVNVRIIP